MEPEPSRPGPSSPDNLVNVNSSSDTSLSRYSQDSSLTDDFSDEESICRSPAKSPTKKSAAVRKLVQRQDPAAAEKAAAAAEQSQPPILLPTDADFQFKEPKFRKKKFIFHPFTRTADNTCVPDPTQVNTGTYSSGLF